MVEIEHLLQRKQVLYRLIKLSGVAITHEDTIKYAQSADPENDCKTIVARDAKGHLCALFLKGMMRVDFSKVNKIVGSSVSILSSEQLKAATGKERGAVCPLQLRGFRMLVDKRIFDNQKIHFSSGDIKFGVEISSRDLEKIFDFEVSDFAK